MKILHVQEEIDRGHSLKEEVTLHAHAGLFSDHFATPHPSLSLLAGENIQV